MSMAVPPPDHFIQRAIQDAVRERIEKEIDAEIKAASERIEKVMRGAVAEIVLRVQSSYRVEWDDRKFTIVVDRKDLRP